MSNLLVSRIDERPDFPLLRVALEPGQKVFAEPGAMVTMTSGVKLSAGLRGGIGATIGRAFGGESLIMSTYAATESGEVTFAPPSLGDIQHLRLDGSGTVLVQRGAFLAHGEGVEVSASWQGARGFFSGQGLVMLKASGRGDLFFNSFGALIPLDVAADGLIVDTGFIVAFEDTVDYQIRSLPTARAGLFSKLKTFFMGGEAIVCEFSGRGRVWIQARQLGSYLSWVHPYRPVKQRSSDD